MKKLSKIFATASLAIVIGAAFTGAANADAASFKKQFSSLVGKSITNAQAKNIVNTASAQGVNARLITNYEYIKSAHKSGVVYIILDGGQNKYKVREIK